MFLIRPEREFMLSVADLRAIVEEARELGFLLQVRHERAHYAAVARRLSPFSNVLEGAEVELARGADAEVVAVAALGALKEVARGDKPWAPQ
jgi:hypothetical protein